MTKNQKTKNDIKDYSSQNLFFKIFLFFRYIIVDIYKKIKEGIVFEEYGVTMYCGRQGAGKTMAMTEYLERMRKKHPNALIVTNYGYKHQDFAFSDWEDFFQYRNGEDGVIFAIDEIQNEFSSSAWNKFPESLLQVVTQQRKQRIKIVCTSQIFTRVVKQLREQCNDVVDCFTFAGRWTFTKSIDAVQYNDAIDSPKKKDDLRTLSRRSFIQDDRIRNLYDSYSVVDKISQTEFLTKQERNV